MRHSFVETMARRLVVVAMMIRGPAHPVFKIGQLQQIRLVALSVNRGITIFQNVGDGTVFPSQRNAGRGVPDDVSSPSVSLS